MDYPFANRLFPASLDVLEHLARWGPTVILSDGDVVFQPRKIERSGLFDAVERRVLVYIHKERELEDVERRFPAEHYVLVDDKVRILTAVKGIWGARVTTVFPRQGHYAHDPGVAAHPAPDVTIERIGDLVDHDLRALLRAARIEDRHRSRARCRRAFSRRTTRPGPAPQPRRIEQRACREHGAHGEEVARRHVGEHTEDADRGEQGNGGAAG